ncbi:hypothetical protein, partial [Tenacibaculum discolor]|uniref:hypothetical protein n=1 Tax=Tenacibaculum discolor TaxID=361581 RepID=UPI00191C712B
AQTVVAMDIAPADVPKRILEWSTFSRPVSASDQVAALLGVTPVVDPGRPAALALNSSAAPAVTQMAAAGPIDRFMPGTGAADPAAKTATAPGALSTAAPG